MKVNNRLTVTDSYGVQFDLSDWWICGSLVCVECVHKVTTKIILTTTYLTWINLPRRCSGMRPARTIVLQLSRSQSPAAVLPWVSPLIVRSLRRTFFHLVWGLSTVCLPSTLVFMILFTYLSSPILSRCPIQLIVAHINLIETSGWHSLSYTFIPNKIVQFTPKIFLSILISNAPNLISSVRISFHVDAPYSRTGRTTALKMFILTSSLTSSFPHSLRSRVPEALVAPASFFLHLV